MGESFTIQISNNLVRQLAGEDEKLNKRSRKPKIRRQPQQSKNGNTKQRFDDSVAGKETSSPVWPLQPPLFLPVSPTPHSESAEVETIRSVLKESEKVVERLQKQGEEVLQEVTQRAKELHDKEFKLPYQKPVPCVAEKDASLECYKEHIKDPLKCSVLVKSFADCVRRYRQQCGG